MAEGASLHILCFRLGGILWGIEADQVDRIARPEEIADGTVVDPTRALGVAPQGREPGRRLVLRPGSERAILLVDEVLDLVSLSPTDLAPVPPLIAECLPDRRIWAVGKKGGEILLLLDGQTLCGRDPPAEHGAGSCEG